MIIFRQIKQQKLFRTIKLTAVLLLLLLNGCDSKVNLKKLCNEHAEICNEFSKDSWCKTERIDVVLNRIKVKNNNLDVDVDVDVDKYKLLIAYEGYIKCMSLASQIQHKKFKEKTTLRKDNLLKATAQLSKLTAQSANSKHPDLLYYHWSRESSDSALKEFLQLEGDPILENSTAQYHLATYYIKRDSNKTLGLLYRSLELHQPGTELSPEILQSLVTIFTKIKQYKQAYIWLRTYQLSQDEPNEMIETSLNSYQQKNALDADFLDKVASSTLAKIKAGQFTSPSF
jgi:hypothetical protein